MILNRRGVRAFLVAAMFALALAIPSAQSLRPVAAPTPAASTIARPNLSRIHIDNFGMINANYFRGAQPKGRDYADLAAVGVKAIIDLTDDDGQASEPAMARNAGIKSFKIPMSGHVPPTREQLAQFMSIVNDPANQPVYVHCVGGKHRTGVMTAAYRMLNEGWNASQAFSEMKSYKFGADFLHPEFKRFVYNFKPEPKGSVPSVVALTAQPQ
jgi:tyrosine-protein phosphatase SIW14